MKMRLTTCLAATGLLLATTALAAPPATDCPSGGVHYGVIPFDASASFVPLFKRIGGIMTEQLGCPVEVQIGTSYTATIEAMRSGKIDAAEFGPLSYVLAHKVAGAEAVATYPDASGKPDTYTASVVSWPGSGITTLKEVAGHSFAYSDPASTSGHLFPAYALASAGIDPDKGVKAIYAGSHTASFEALRNHKVEAGEINSQQIKSAEVAGIWDPKAYVVLWDSQPIPQDPIAVRGNLPEPFKSRFSNVLAHLDLSSISAADMKFIAMKGHGYVPQTDAAYDQIRSLIGVLHIDEKKLAE